MSVVVMLKSVEFLVDLMRFPGQLVPFSSKAIITSHISAAGESDSADYDSCDSPLEPNSPLCSQRYACVFRFNDMCVLSWFLLAILPLDTYLVLLYWYKIHTVPDAMWS
jgi:hypothetical protein